MLTSKLSIQIHKGYKSFFHFHFPFHPFTVLTLSLSPLWKKNVWSQGLTSFSSWKTAVSAVVLGSRHLMLRNRADNNPFANHHKPRDNHSALHQMPLWRNRKSIRIFRMSVWAVFLPLQVISGIKWKLFRSSPPIC